MLFRSEKIFQLGEEMVQLLVVRQDQEIQVVKEDSVKIQINLEEKEVAPQVQVVVEYNEILV